MKRKTILVIFCLALTSGLVGYEVYRRISTASPAGGPPGGAGPAGGPGGRGTAAVAVEVAPVEIGEVRELGFFSGSLQARTRFVLAPKVPGRLDRITVDVGDRVRKGQAVAVLDDREYSGQVQQAEADLDVVKANLEDARSSLETAGRELERARTLFEGKIASRTELDAAETGLRKAETQYRVLQAQLRQKEAALETVRERLDSTRLVAEWDSGGETRVIGERYADPGALLRANDPVVSILDIGYLTATVNVTESIYGRMRPGLQARVITDALPGRIFEGEVERVAPFLNPTSRQADVRIGIPNPSGLLKPGMFVRVTLEYGRRDSAVTVPVAALVKRGERDGVFLLSEDAGKVQFVPVQAGVTDSGRVEIVEPRLSGEVVTLGHHLLQDGSAVSLPGAGSGRP